MSEKRSRPEAGLGENENGDLLLVLRPFLHGQWGHLNLNRIALFARNLRHVFASHNVTRFQDAIRDYLEKTYPAIRNLGDRTSRTRLAPDVIQSLNTHTGKLAELLAKFLHESSYDDDRLGQLEREIPNHVDEVLRAFKTIRNGVFARFRCNPAEATHRALQELRPLLRESETELSIDVTASSSDVEISQDDLLTTMRLLIRACVNSMEGRTGKRLVMHSRTHVDRWIFELRDTGPGFPLEFWNEAFSAERNLEGHSNFDLADAKAILQKYDGELCIKESTVGQGTTFLVSLRLAAA